MCTIAVAFRAHPDRPVVLAANRDEYYARPARGPGPLGVGPGGRIVGGRDERAGGTWLALREDGAFAAITNQRNFAPRDASKQSRGELPIALLAQPVREMAAFARALDPAAYNEGNLIFGGADGVWVAYLRDGATSTECVALAPGLHVLTNDKLGSPDFPRADRAHALLAPAIGLPWPEALPLVERALGDHARPPDDRVGLPPPCAPFGKDLLAALQQVCIHTPAYGTRSSTIAALGADRVLAYHHAEGHPCESPFRDAMAVLR